MKKIAVVKDRTQFWPLYQKEFEKHGFQVELFDIWQQKEQERLLSGSYDAFIWRAKHNPSIKRLARRFLYMFDQEFNIPTFPDWHHYWHYDDKIGQSYLLKKYEIPSPQTFIFYKKEDALDWLETASFPLVFKCAHGAGSANVGLFKNANQARKYIKKVFGRGVKTFFKNEIQRDYVYLQEFIKGTEGDCKLICYNNNRVHGIYRENRKDAPFASGSGKTLAYDFPEEVLQLVADANSKLNYNFMSYDLLKTTDDKWLISEFGIIFGDLKNTIYDQTPIYSTTNQGWQSAPMQDNQVERLIEHLLKNVWKWI